MKQMRWVVISGWVLLAGCAADPELASYSGGGRARSRGERQLVKAAGATAEVAGVVGLAAVTGGSLSWEKKEGLVVKDDEGPELTPRKKRR